MVVDKNKNPRLRRAYILVGRNRQQKIIIKKRKKLYSILEGGKHHAKTEQVRRSGQRYYTILYRVA